MKYDYYIAGKKYPSKVDAIEFAKANIKKQDFELVRRVKKVDEVIIPSIREFLKTGVPFKSPTISPLILKKRETEKVEAVKDANVGVKITKIKPSVAKKVKKNLVSALAS